MDAVIRRLFPRASDEKLRFYRGSLVVVGAMLIHFTLGVLYTAGNMNTYISSYIRARVDPTWTYAKSTWFYTANQWTHGLSMVIAGFFEYKFGPRIVTTVGCLLFTGGIGGTFFTIKIHPVLTVLSYGVFFGFKGIAYGVSLTCGMKWFPDRKAFVAGVILSAFGLAAFVLTPMQTAFLNPHNVAPVHIPPAPPSKKYFLDEGVLNRVPNVFLLMGGLFFVIQGFGCFFLAPAPKPKVNQEQEAREEVETSKEETGTRVSSKKGELIEGEQDTEAQSKKGKGDPKTPEVGSPEKEAAGTPSDIRSLDEKYSKTESDGTLEAGQQEFQGDVSLTPRKVLQTRQFYMLFFTFFLNQQAIGYLSNMYKVFGMSFIDSDRFLAAVGSIAAIGNALGRPVWGAVSDRFGYKISMMMITGLMATFIATLPFTKYGGKFVYAAWIVSLNLIMSGHYSLMPSCCVQSFGGTFASSNYGMIFASSLISSTLQSLMLSNLTPILGDNVMIWMTSGFAASSFLINVFYDKRPSPGAIREAHDWPPYREME